VGNGGSVVVVVEDLRDPSLERHVAVEHVEHPFVDQGAQWRHRGHEAGHRHRQRVRHLRGHLPARDGVRRILQHARQVGGSDHRGELIEGLVRQDQEPTLQVPDLVS
jgi:hypothetical protein